MSQQLPPPVVARVQAVDGTLLRLTPTGFAGALSPGDAAVSGDVLVTGADSQVAIDLVGGGALLMTGSSRAVIHATGEHAGGALRLVVLSGALVVDATGAGAAGLPLHVESAAAELIVHGGTLAVSYELASGFRAALLADGAGDGAAAQIVNDGGTYLLDAAHPAVVVARWSDPPQALSVSQPDASPDWLADAGGFGMAGDAVVGPGSLPLAAEAHALPLVGHPDDGHAHDPDAVPVAADTDHTGIVGSGDGAPAFMTGAGMPEAGDIAFMAPQTARGLADHAVPGPAPIAPFSILAAPVAPALQPAAPSWRPALSTGPDHGIDALYGLQPQLPDAPALPPSPEPPEWPRLSGWEPSGRLWELEGSAVSSGGDREGPWSIDGPLNLITPVEGETMARLAPNGVDAYTLGRFLDLPQQTLETLVDGVVAKDGSAMRTVVTLEAGQTLAFDTLFDAASSLPDNDFAAFTVSAGGRGEAFVLSSVATTGDLGATPWQSFAYTASAAGRYTVGFVVINDTLPETPARLFVDNMRDHLDTDGLALIGEQDGALGGHFAQYEPQPLAPEAGGETLVDSFETRIAYGEGVGRIDSVSQFAEPDGAGGAYSATDGAAMAVLHAYGASRPAIERLLGLQPAPGAAFALPSDIDGSAPAFGAATRLAVAVEAGDQVSFDWLFDAGDALPDNDFAVFTVADGDDSTIFKLSDVRSVGDGGASGWRTSVYTAAADADLTLGFAVVNDRIAGYYSDTDNSRLLIDNVRLNRDFADGYQTVDLVEPGTMTTLPLG